MKKIYSIWLVLTALLVCCPWTELKAETLTVSEWDTTNEFVPFYGWYGDNSQHNQLVIPSGDLEEMSNGSITNIKFHTSQTTSISWSTAPQVTIRLTEISSNTLDALDDNGSSGTAVYTDKAITFVKGETYYYWNIDLDNSYKYGGGNLLIDIQTTYYSSSTYAHTYFTGKTTSDNVAFTYGSARKFYPQTTFTYTPGEAPSCPKPKLSLVGTPTASSASFSWEKGGDETQWQYLCLPASVELTDELWDDATLTSSTSVTLNELSGSSAYKFYLRAFCAVDDQSGVVSASFATDCGEVSVFPWDANLTGTNFSAPKCMTVLQTSDQAYSTSIYNNELRFSGNNSSSYKGRKVVVVLPATSTDITGLKLTITYKNYGTSDSYPDFVVGYVTSTSDVTTFQALDTLSKVSSYTKSSAISLSKAAIGSYIAIACTNVNGGSSSVYSYISSIHVENATDCSKPDTPVASELTGTTAHLAWTAKPGVTAYKYLNIDRTANPEATLDWNSAKEVNTNSVDLTELVDGHAYDFYVMCACGTEASDACQYTPLSCPSVTGVELTTPLYNGITVGWTTSGVTTCDVRYKASDDENWTSAGTELESPKAITGLVVGKTYSFAVKPHCNDAEEAWVVAEETYTPAYTVPGEPTLSSTPTTTSASFTWAAATGGATGYEYVYSVGAAAADWTSPVAADERTATLSGLTDGTNYTLYVRAKFGEGRGKAVSKNFTTATIAPVLSAEYTATKTSATFTWTNEGSATQYQWSLNNSSWSEPISALTATAEGLTAGTSYTFYLRAYYAETIQSASVNLPFVTECDTKAIGWSETFSSDMPTCWSTYYTYWGTSSYQWKPSSDVKKRGSYSMVVNSYQYSSSNIANLETPSIAITEKANLSFYYLCENAVPFSVIMKVNGKETELASYNASKSSFGNDSTVIAIPDTCIGKTLSIIFRATGAGTNVKRKLYIDEVAINYAPIAAPTELAAVPTADGANLTWSHAENGPFDVQYRAYKAEAPFNDWTDVEGTINTKAHTLTGLTEGTKYEVRVRANASEHRVSEWTEPIAFTPQSCASVSEVTFDAAAYDTVVVNWTVIGTGKWNLRYKTAETEWTTVENIDALTYTLKNLTTEVEYTVQVQATCGGETWTEAKITLAYTAPTNVQVPSATITDAAATASWDAVSDAEGYKIAVVARGEAALFGDKVTTKTDTTFTGLAAATEYDFYVATVYGEHLESSAKVEFATKTVAPKNLKVSALGATTATLAWENDGAATKYEWAEGSDANKLSWEEVETNSKTIDTLKASTSYTFYVRSKYANGATSDSIKTTFTTECNTYSLPFIETFNGLTSGQIPDCWNNAEGTATTKWGCYTYGAYEGGKCVRFDSYNNSNGLTNILATPAIALDKKAILKFWCKNPQGGAYEVLIAEVGAAKRDTLFKNLTSISSWTEKEKDLSDYEGKTVKLYFCGTSNWGNNDAYLYLDSVTITEKPACPAPKALKASNVLYNAATLSWTNGDSESAWNIRYKVAEGEWDTIAGVTANPYVFSASETGSSYTVQVQAACDEEHKSDWSNEEIFTPNYIAPSDVTVSEETTNSAKVTWTANSGETAWTLKYKKSTESEWTSEEVNTNAEFTLSKLAAGTYYDVCVLAGTATSATKSFNTDCPESVAPLGYTEGFEGKAVGSSTSDAPLCWALLNANEGTYPYIYVNTETTYVQTGSKSLYFNGSGSKYGYAILPVFSGSYAGLQITFSHLEESNTSSGIFTIGYFTNITDEATFNVLQVCERKTKVWQEETVSLNTVPENARLAFRYGDGTNNWYAGIDDISISEIPACAVPTGLKVDEYGTDTATLSWTSDASAWKLQTSADGENWNEAIDVDANPFVLRELTENTRYFVRVAAICDKATSDYCAAIDFRTECAPKAISKEAAWSENFNEITVNTLPSCWEVVGDENYATAKVTADGVEESNALTISSQSTSNATYPAVVILPELSAETDLLQIDFQYKNGNASSNYGQLQVGYYAESTFTAVETLDRVDDKFTAVSVELTGSPEGARIAFQVTGGSKANTTTAIIDNAVVSFHPTCYTPKNLAVEAGNASATLTWEAGKDETAWEVRYKATAAEEWTTIAETINTTPSYVISGLTNGTEYEAQVRAYCGSEDQSEWTKSVVFTPSTTTGMGELNADGKKAVKIIENGILYILRDGEKYNAQGAKVQ